VVALLLHRTVLRGRGEPSVRVHCGLHAAINASSQSAGDAGGACLHWRHRERTRRSSQENKMNKPYSRISENVLFAALLAAVIGWTAISVVADQPAASTSQVSVAATSAIRNS
jgi:hypothetical protein